MIFKNITYWHAMIFLAKKEVGFHI